jgi:acetyl esterase/lipase
LQLCWAIPFRPDHDASRSPVPQLTETTSKGRITMHHFFFVAAMCALTATSSVALAQVPPDIAEGIRKIGPIIDGPGTQKLYAPLFANQKEPYQDVTVVRDIAYGTNPLQKLDVFTAAPTTGAPKPVVIFLHGGGFERGDKRQPGTPFYDNIMLWLAQQGMVGVNMNYRLAPKHVWPAAHEDLAAAVQWAQANIVQHGGDPDRLVLWGTSAGADMIAGYLAYPQFHGPKGNDVKAAIMSSGFYEKGAPAYFGTDPAERWKRLSTEGLKKVTIPLFVSRTELDTPTAVEQTDALNKALCDAGCCPTYVVFKDHGHLSQGYSFGTPDRSVSGPILEFLRKVN